jgi:uncharacterized protein (TIGR02466 family)
MILNYHFPTPIWWEQTNFDNTKIEELAYRIKRLDPKGRIISNRGGWQSRDIEPNTYLELVELEKTILINAVNCFKDYGYEENSKVISIDNLWLNINGRGCTNAIHTHPTAFVSGVYYIKAEPDQGKIVFHKNSLEEYIISSNAPIDNYNPLNFSAVSFEPLTGKMILFPGYLPHGVDSNNTDQDRISISFNIKLVN